MLGNDAMEFLKTLHNLDEIWKQHGDAEYNERQLTQFAERYHEHKLKLLGIGVVVGRSKQLCECYDSHESAEVEVVEICCRCKKPTT